MIYFLSAVHAANRYRMGTEPPYSVRTQYQRSALQYFRATEGKAIHGIRIVLRYCLEFDRQELKNAVDQAAA